MPDSRWFAEVLRAEVLAPISVVLSDNRSVPITSLLRRERRSDLAVAKTASCWAPNKVAIDFDAGSTWEEYAIVRLLEGHGWWACWVKHWYGSREFCLNPGEPTQIPAAAAEVFRTIEAAGGGRSGGAWDVYAWKNGPLFIESKQHRSSDRLNANQIAWLSAAVSIGTDPARFAVMSYDAGPPAGPLVTRATTMPESSSGARFTPQATGGEPATRAKSGLGILDQVRSSKPPPPLGACSGLTKDGLRC